MLIGFIQQGPKSVIPRSGATWESPGTASVIAAFYQEIATPYGLAMTNSEACCVKPISIYCFYYSAVLTIILKMRREIKSEEAH